MKVTITITIADQTSEEEMNAKGVTSGDLLKFYTEGFENLLQNIQTKDTKTDLHVVVMDNTKEAKT